MAAKYVSILRQSLIGLLTDFHVKYLALAQSPVNCNEVTIKDPTTPPARRNSMYTVNL